MIKKIKLENKKGSHVGVVVSFAIFITFLVFLYAILEPTTVRQRDKQYILDYLKINLLGNTTGNLTTMIIEIEGPIPKTCVQLQNVPEETIPEEVWHNLLFVHPNGESLEYYLKQNKIYVYCGLGFDGFLTVYYGEDIIGKENDGLEKDCHPHETTVGFVRTFSEIFGIKMVQLNDTYYADYEVLKAHLGIPEGTEFSFYLLDGERNVIISAEMYPAPTDRAVHVEETPIQYIDEGGNTLFGFLVIKVW